MKNRYVLLLDLPLIAISAFGAFAARFDWRFYETRTEFLTFLLAALLVKPAVFLFMGLYRRYWRYASIQELLLVFVGVTAASVLMGALVTGAIALKIIGFSRVVLATDWLLTLVLTGGLRLSIRLVHESIAARHRGEARTVRRVLIAGAGDAGALVVREMRRNPQLGLQPAGFVDDDPVKRGKDIGGQRVLGGTALIPELVAACGIDTVIIAMPRAGGRAIRGIVELCRQAGVRSLTVPGVFEVLDGHVSMNRLRNVEITDLLQREPLLGDARPNDFVVNRVVMITGGGGSIGSELARQIANARPSHLVLLGHGENSLFETQASLRSAFPDVRLSCTIADIRNDRRLSQVFDAVRPAVVFHAAAHKHVPLMEENPEEAVTNNVIGTRNVVKHALRVGTERFVLISTDKAVVPTSIMGATKRIAEAIVRRAAVTSGRPYVAVRFGNVLGSRGSVVHTFKRQIEQGGPVTVTHPDMTRFFMTIPEAVHLVLQASGLGKAGDLFVLDMGQPVKIADLARDLIKLSGFSEEEIPIVFSGIRPGEKLEEALFDPGMQTTRTSHPDILQVIGDDRVIDPALDSIVAELEHAAGRGDRAAIEGLLSATIPGYLPRATAYDGTGSQPVLTQH